MVTRWKNKEGKRDGWQEDRREMEKESRCNGMDLDVGIAGKMDSEMEEREEVEQLFVGRGVNGGRGNRCGKILFGCQ